MEKIRSEWFRTVLYMSRVASKILLYSQNVFEMKTNEKIDSRHHPLWHTGHKAKTELKQPIMKAHIMGVQSIVFAILEGPYPHSKYDINADVKNYSFMDIKFWNSHQASKQFWWSRCNNIQCVWLLQVVYFDVFNIINLS